MSLSADFSSSLPQGAPTSLERLFPGAAVGLLAEPANPLVIGRILEDGEAADLKWLAAIVGEEELRRWVAERGGRQLSPRSRSLWSLVLGVAPSPSSELEKELWNL